MAEWFDYQERVAEFFRTRGAHTHTNVTLTGARSTHDVDVVVRTESVGFSLLWLVECKHWSKPVNKLHVLALRTIVQDVGADRGMILAENGFQSGARECADLTNVWLGTLTELSEIAAPALDVARVQTYTARFQTMQQRYWRHGKRVRQDYDLRPELGDGPGVYSVLTVLNVAEYALEEAQAGRFPIDTDTGLRAHLGPTSVGSVAELTQWLDVNLVEMDRRMLAAEHAMFQDGRYAPRGSLPKPDTSFRQFKLQAGNRQAPDAVVVEPPHEDSENSL